MKLWLTLDSWWTYRIDGVHGCGVWVDEPSFSMVTGWTSPIAKHSILNVGKSIAKHAELERIDNEIMKFFIPAIDLSLERGYLYFLYNTPMTFPFKPTPAQLQFATYTKGLSTLNAYTKEQSQWDMWDFIRTVTGLYYKDISKYESLNDEKWFAEFWNKNQFKLVTVYDHTFDSDESCSLQVLTSFEMPVAAWKKIGDKSSYDAGLVVLNNAWGLEVSKTVFEAQRDEDELIADENLDVAKWIFADNQYLNPVCHPAVDPLTYLIESPGWMLGRLDPERNKLQVVDEVSNTTLRVTKIQGVKKSANSWSTSAYHRTTLTLENGEAKEVDTNSILVSPMRN